ncbi:MAG TPA: ABC transporter ATP-binding protein [Thermohalobaculum sp.]|nr:ABC transporter ATP-binding protein [Thermohalobaculum sp.]
MPSPDAISAEGLSVAFGEGTARSIAADRVTFRVAEGGSFGLVGESGSGKTTVLRAIAGLIGDWTGGLTVRGETLGPRRQRGFYRTVQMVFQDPYASLHPRHTVDRTLSEPLRLHRFDRVEARIEEGLRAVGLGPEFRFRYPHQLSGGQRQRVAIARALMLEPRILLLDEPTSALDVSVQAEVLNLLADLRSRRGLTFLLVSHDLAVVAHMCEEIAVMQGGRIVETLDVDAMRRMEPREDYTRHLLRASMGYVPEETG